MYTPPAPAAWHRREILKSMGIAAAVALPGVAFADWEGGPDDEDIPGEGRGECTDPFTDLSDWEYYIKLFAKLLMALAILAAALTGTYAAVAVKALEAARAAWFAVMTAALGIVHEESRSIWDDPPRPDFSVKVDVPWIPFDAAWTAELPDSLVVAAQSFLDMGACLHAWLEVYEKGLGASAEGDQVAVEERAYELRVLDGYLRALSGEVAHQIPVILDEASRVTRLAPSIIEAPEPEAVHEVQAMVNKVFAGTLWEGKHDVAQMVEPAAGQDPLDLEESLIRSLTEIQRELRPMQSAGKWYPACRQN